MIRFKEFIVEAAKKAEGTSVGHVGIKEIPPHATGKHDYALNHHELGEFIKGGHIDASNITEKTDGRPHTIEVDHHGRVAVMNSSTGNKRLYSHEEIENELKTRADKKGVQYEGSNYEKNAEKLKDLHSKISGNKALVKHLQDHAKKTGEPASVSGEIYDHRDAATHEHYDESNPATHHLKGLKHNEVVPTVTPYSKDRLHHSGVTFVVHKEMNPDHDTEKLKSLADDKMGIHDDKVENEHKSIDVKKEHDDLHKLVNSKVGSNKNLKHPQKDHPINSLSVGELLDTKDKELDDHGKAAKAAARDKVGAIGAKVKSKVEKALHSNLNTSKWNSNEGRSPEAVVIHPTRPGVQRVKVLSKKFAESKAQGAGTAWAVKK